MDQTLRERNGENYRIKIKFILENILFERTFPFAKNKEKINMPLRDCLLDFTRPSIKEVHVHTGIPKKDETSETIVHGIHSVFIHMFIVPCNCKLVSSNISFKKLYARQNTKFTHQILVF